MSTSVVVLLYGFLLDYTYDIFIHQRFIAMVYDTLMVLQMFW